MKLPKKIGRLVDKHFWIAFMLYSFVMPGLAALLLIWISTLGFHNELPELLQLIFDWCLENIIIPTIIIICVPFVIIQVSKNNP